MVLDDPLLGDYLESLGYRLVAQSDKPEQGFTFFLVRDEAINAFAAPGGFVGVNTGLVTTAESVSELAAVLAHETAHITQKHLVRAFECGAVDFVAKPFVVEELLARVRTHLELKFARDHLKRVAREREDLASLVAHDLKNPLGSVLFASDMLRQPALADTLERLATEGLAGFYTGALAADIAADLAALGSPVRVADLAAHVATRPAPLHVPIRGATLYNSAPPTQGFASLLILALFDRLAADAADGFDHVHGLVEATKQAFLIRDTHVGDPEWHDFDYQGLLDDPAALDALAASIDPATALPWPQPPQYGDTCWFAAADGAGRVVSCIQSTYHEFGSGLVLPTTGITWQNRGASFRLAETGWNALKPGRKPFHTLNPALARFDDGRTMAYGTMGGEGQPQTQAALFTRHARYGVDLQEAISRPRWLLGRTWGDQSTTLKLEDGFDDSLYARLAAAGHDVERVGPLTATMGHAGAILRHADGRLDGATDPRSDGGVATW